MARAGLPRSVFFPGQALCAALAPLLFLPAPAAAGTPSSFTAQPRTSLRFPTEYDVKAACLYKLVKYITWPPSEGMHNEKLEEFRIGILGKDPFGSSWKLLEGKQLKGKPVTFVHFGNLPESPEDRLEVFRCKVLFVAFSEEKRLKEALKLARGKEILTFGEGSTFLARGGAIRFVVVERKVRFEINLAALKREKFSIKTSVLRLAHRVIQKDELGEEKQ